MRLSTCIHAASGRQTRRIPARPGFTLVELLVVIGIIGLLIGLLLPALGKVIQRAKSTQTLGTMQEFSKACDAYFQEFGEYPAAVPDEALYAGIAGAGSTGGSDSVPPAAGQLPRITAMENALLALMGGYRVQTDPDYATFGQTSTPPAVAASAAEAEKLDRLRSERSDHLVFIGALLTGVAIGLWIEGK
jgi:prepilin-type N-terminal cleavage/methylation domain-containing protein